MAKRVFLVLCFVGVFTSNVVLAGKRIFSINDIHLARPELKCKSDVHYQPVELHLKFFDFDAGLMLYTTSGKIKRPMPLILFFAFHQPIEKFSGQRYYLDHANISAPIQVSGDKLTIHTKGKISEDVLQFLNHKHKLIFQHKLISTEQANRLKQIGIVVRLPKWIWKQGGWQVGNKKGVFTPAKSPNRPAEKILSRLDKNSKLLLRLPGGKGTIIIRAKCSYDELYYLNCSGNLGMFFDLFFVKNISVKQDIGKLAEDAFDISFEGKIVPEIWETFSLSQEKYEKLKSLKLTPHSSFGRQRGNERFVDKCLPYQCMDKSNAFYGAVFKFSNNAEGHFWHDIPVRTRDFAFNLMRLYKRNGTKYYNRSSALERISAGLDYISQATTPFGQYGDVRLRGWGIMPYLSGIMPIAEIVYYIGDEISAERKQNWLATLFHLYNAAEKILENNIRTRSGDGANLMTYSQQIFDVATVLNDAAGKNLAHEGVHCAIEPEFNPKYGVRRDFSYRQGNLFDVGYYHWLVTKLGSYVSVSHKTQWALTDEEQNWLENICRAFVWLYDNGLLNTMTSHPKNRLSLKLFPERIALFAKEKVNGIETVSRQSYRWRGLKTNKEKESFVCKDNESLPVGAHWFRLAKYYIRRTKMYYASVWWNSNVSVRDFEFNANYNAKVPLGAMFVRWISQPREVSIPSDNINYSGIVFLKDMLDVKDWASGFENYAGSELLGPLVANNYSLLGGRIVIRSRQHPKRKVYCLKTVILADNEIIVLDTIKESPYWRDVVVQPFVLRRYTDLAQKITVNGKELSDSEIKNGYNVNETFNLVSATSVFNFVLKNCVGNVNLSKTAVDGSQRYSFYKPAKVLRVWLKPASSKGGTVITRWRSQRSKSESDKAKIIATNMAHLLLKEKEITGVIYRCGNISEGIEIIRKGNVYYVSLKGFSKIAVAFYQPNAKCDVKVNCEDAKNVKIERRGKYLLIGNNVF